MLVLLTLGNDQVRCFDKSHLTEMVVSTDGVAPGETWWKPLVPVSVHTRIVRASGPGPAHGASAVSRSACRMPGSAATLTADPCGLVELLRVFAADQPPGRDAWHRPSR
jgi:hypothetical protein